jgi:hypothetical protein
MAGGSAKDPGFVTKRVLDLDPRTYRRHAIHQEGRVWAETNCYVDVWIELLHALGHDPVAALPFTFAIDFEGDQWTFFKYPLRDLFDLYRLDVQELAIWRPLAAHIEEQVAGGRPVLVELDSYYLPDTSGTAYRRLHTKSTAAIVEIDLDQQFLGYFHNQGYYHLEGDDFLDALRLRGEPGAAGLAPYVEFVKTNPGADARPLLRRSLALLRGHLAAVPGANPFARFKARLEKDLDHLLSGGLEMFHQYSFATVRQFGACFELAQTYLEWLAAHGEAGLDGEIQGFSEIAQGAKAFQFHLARAMNRGKPPDLAPLDVMGGRWQRAMRSLQARYAAAD